MFHNLIKIVRFVLIVSSICSLIIMGIKNSIMLILTFLVASSISVFVHELGHYLMSIFLGNKPKYFIVGTTLYGLNFFNGLIKFNFKNTRFIINPFGHAGSLESFTYMNKIDEWKMILISVAGPLFNLLSAILVLSFQVDFIQYCINHRTVLSIYETIHIFLLFGFLFSSFFYFIGNLINIKSSDGWFANQLIKKFDERDTQFFDFAIHKLHDEKLIDKKSYKDYIEPLYNSYNEIYENRTEDICTCSELKYYYYSFLTITLGLSFFILSLILDAIPSLAYEMTYVQRSGGLLIVSGIIIQFFLLAIKRREVENNVVTLECGPEESKIYKNLNIISYVIMIFGTVISSYYDLFLHILKSIIEIIKYI